MNDLQQQLDELKIKISKLEDSLTARGITNDFTELIRDVVVFDADSQTSISSGSTSVVTGVNFVAQTVSTANIASLQDPTILLRVYFREKIYNIPAYAIS